MMMLGLLSGIWSLGVRALPVGLGLVCLFLSQALLARLLGVETFGAYGYALTWVLGAALIGRAGYEWALMKRLPGLRRDGSHAASQFVLVRVYRAVAIRACVAAIVVGVFMVTVGAMGQVLGPMSAIAAALLVVALSVGGVNRAWGLSHGTVWLAEAPENIVKPIAFVLVVAGVLSVGGTISDVATLIWINLGITSLCVGAGFALLVANNRKIFAGRAAPQDMADSQSLMRAMWLTTVLNMILRNADVLVVGALTDAASTGLYIAASRLAAVAGAPSTVLDQVVAPRIAGIHAEGDKRALRAVALEYGLLSGAGSVAFLIALAVLGPSLVVAIFGESFRASASLAWILLVGHAVNSLTGPTGILLSMTGSHRTSLAVATISAIAFLALLWVLTPVYKAPGAALAFTLTAIFKNALQVAIITRKLQINPTVLPLSAFGRRR